jgi:Flp pilus assembly pilin Flp
VGSSVWRFVANFAEEEQGQDLVEYALLGAFVAIATILGLKAIEGAIGTQYRWLDSGEQNIWQPPNP